MQSKILAVYVIKVYAYFSCCFVFVVDSDFIQGVKRVFGSDDRKELVDPYFVFSFAGREVSCF